MTSRTDGSVDTLDTICFVHWSACPDASEVHRATDGVVGARRRAGRPLVIISFIPNNSEVPGREAREAIHMVAPIVNRMCEVQYAVFHGSSIRARILRAFLAAVAFIMPSAVEVLDTADTALQRAGARLGVDPATLIAAARARGIIA